MDPSQIVEYVIIGTKEDAVDQESFFKNVANYPFDFQIESKADLLDQYADYLLPKLGIEGVKRFREQYINYKGHVTMPQQGYNYIDGAPEIIRKMAYFYEVIRTLKNYEREKIRSKSLSDRIEKLEETINRILRDTN